MTLVDRHYAADGTLIAMHTHCNHVTLIAGCALISSGRPRRCRVRFSPRPRAGLIAGRAGHLYGAVTYGGNYGLGYGAVFEVTP
jgi:hypothetical protein